MYVVDVGRLRPFGSWLALIFGTHMRNVPLCAFVLDRVSESTYLPILAVIAYTGFMSVTFEL